MPASHVACSVSYKVSGAAILKNQTLFLESKGSRDTYRYNKSGSLAPPNFSSLTNPQHKTLLLPTSPLNPDMKMQDYGTLSHLKAATAAVPSLRLHNNTRTFQTPNNLSISKPTKDYAGADGSPGTDDAPPLYKSLYESAAALRWKRFTKVAMLPVRQPTYGFDYLHYRMHVFNHTYIVLLRLDETKVMNAPAQLPRQTLSQRSSRQSKAAIYRQSQRHHGSHAP